MTKKLEMSDDERRARHYRSLELYNASILMSVIATVIAILGVALWPLLVCAAILLCIGFFIGRRADSVSPYESEKS